MILDISWSPDGRWLAYARSLSDYAATAELCLTRVADGESFLLSAGTAKETSPAWSPDSRALWFVSDRGGISDLWRFTPGPKGLPDGTPRQVTVGLEVLRVAASADGTRLAITKGRTIRNVFRAPILTNRPAAWTDATQLTSDEAAYEMIDVSRDGRVIVASDRSGNWDVWTMSSNGEDLARLTTDPAVDAGPRWKPDGSEVLFYSTRTGHREVWILPVGGGPPRQLTRGEEESWYPAWSPDAREVVVKRASGLFVVPAQGGEARRLTDGPYTDVPDWSPDGRWVALISDRHGAPRLSRVPVSGGPIEELAKRAGACPRWSSDGKGIYFIGIEDAAGAIWELSVDSRRERPVTALSGRRGRLSASRARDRRAPCLLPLGGVTRGHLGRRHPPVASSINRPDPTFDVVATDFNQRNHIVVRFAERDIERSGWLNGEKYIAGKTAMASVAYDQGRVALIGFRTRNRAQTHGTFKFLLNALVAGYFARSLCRLFAETPAGVSVAGTGRRTQIVGRVGLEFGWETGIRTPISWSRARCPTVERSPSTGGLAAGRKL